MNIVHITAGAGGMFCGICLRDNALVAALRKLGHHATMVPLYLPLTLDEEDQSAGTPIFFSGINVYLEQKSALFREAPDWFRHLMAARPLLKWVGAKAAKTRPENLGDLTLSMLRGEDGFQSRELDELITWLHTQPKPDVVCLSNALLVGLARKIKTELGTPVVCMLQGEVDYLDALLPEYRTQCWKTLSERAKGVDLFGAASRYFGDLMSKRMNLTADRVKVVYSGINLDGFSDSQPASSATGTSAPVLGYFARMCPEKGLDTLVDSYIQLRQRDRIKGLHLRIGGGCGAADQQFVNSLRQRLSESGFLKDVEFFPNLDRAEKVKFLQSLSIFSVPARCTEAFGLYAIEAMAAGVPVVQPRTGAFPEIIEATGGGISYEGDSNALAVALEELLSDPERARALGRAGKRAALEKFSAEAMSRSVLDFYQEAVSSPAPATSS
jgi:glycosyltransferase involved in cell wall biosynthesis